MTEHVKLKVNYSCPHCKAFLRVWNNIIFTVSSPDKAKRGILLLNPHLGDYTLTSHETLDFAEGEIVEFYCPVCLKDLRAKDINENLVRVVMSDDEDGRTFDVYFSRIVGEHSTFKIEDNDIIEKFGEDDSHYVNYFLSKLRQ